MMWFSLSGNVILAGLLALLAFYASSRDAVPGISSRVVAWGSVVWGLVNVVAFYANYQTLGFSGMLTAAFGVALSLTLSLVADVVFSVLREASAMEPIRINS